MGEVVVVGGCAYLKTEPSSRVEEKVVYQGLKTTVWGDLSLRVCVRVVVGGGGGGRCLGTPPIFKIVAFPEEGSCGCALPRPPPAWGPIFKIVAFPEKGSCACVRVAASSESACLGTPPILCQCQPPVIKLIPVGRYGLRIKIFFFLSSLS